MANLAELQKYFTAASECVKEILDEEGPSALGDIDTSMLSEGGPELNSPSHIGALQKVISLDFQKYTQCEHIILFIQ